MVLEALKSRERDGTGVDVCSNGIVIVFLGIGKKIGDFNCV